MNFVVADTQQWEQAAAYAIDTHPRVRTFVKNAGLGLGIPYLHNGQMHEYVPHFLIQLHDLPGVTLILETKGYDPLADVKKRAAERWVAAVDDAGKDLHRHGKEARSTLFAGRGLRTPFRHAPLVFIRARSAHSEERSAISAVGEKDHSAWNSPGSRREHQVNA